MITGNQNPVAGKDEFYTFTDYTQMFETPDIQYNWAIWKKKTGKWVNITERPPKPGKSVSFNFGQGAIGEEFRLEVYKAKKKLLSNEWEAKKMGEIFVVPTNSKTPKISKVVLFNRGARDPNKASYQDTLIAQAHCVAMFNQEVEFNLWEDDATGGGHNAEINKNNKAPKIYKARVNEKGIAEAKISLLSDANVLKQIANRYMMRGDPNEGANHEFYVTASHSGKIKGDSKVNVSVANPDHRPKTKPKDDTPKFPIGSTGAGGGVRQPDPEGNIRDAYFVNNNGQQLSKVSIGEHVKIRILSKNMIGNRIQYVVWEYDATSNDEVYRSGVIKIIADACDTGGFTISPNIFDKGIDFGSVDSDAKKQNYFIEIISFDTSNTSKKFGVTADGLMTVEKAKSAAVVQNTPAPNTSSTCLCKEHYKDLIWGEKVSCEFRKKVVEISQILWPNNYMEMANGLMAVMNVETWGSFKAHHREGYKTANDNPNDLTISSFHKDNGSKSSRAVGLIQFTQDALEGMGEFPKSTPFTKGTQTRYDDLNKLKLSYALMGEIDQLNKVKKYFEPAKSKIKTPEDIYLHVFAPKGVGQKDDFLLYEKDTIEYKNNKSVDKDNNGIQRKEILARFYKSKTDGINSKTSKFTCGIDDKKVDTLNATDIVTYHIYADGKIEKHIPKEIKLGYEKKYKYVFHDKENKEHEICTVDFIFANKRENGITITSIPKGYTNTYSYPRGGNAQTAYVYSNGDICVEGTRYGFKKYPKGTGKVELVRMKDSLSYNNGNVKIYYSFKSSQRRYCNPESYAGFIGALATLGRTDVLCTGMCFEDATSYPSVTHPNGDSADTAYYSTLTVEQKKVNAFKYFNFKNIYRGKTGWYPSLIGTKYSKGHEDHLHAGDFDSSIVKTIKE